MFADGTAAAAVKDDAGGKLEATARWPSGVEVRTSVAPRGFFSADPADEHLVLLQGSEALRFALRLLQWQAGPDVPLLPDHRRALAAAVAAVRAAARPEWLEHLDAAALRIAASGSEREQGEVRDADSVEPIKRAAAAA